MTGEMAPRMALESASHYCVVMRVWLVSDAGGSWLLVEASLVTAVLTVLTTVGHMPM